MANTLLARALSFLEEKKVHNLYRVCQSNPNAGKTIELASNDYRHLRKDPSILQAAKNTLEEDGTTAGGSPVVNGYFPIHQKLETALAEWAGFPHAIIWSSGLTLNEALLKVFPAPEDVILTDRYIHYSVLKGAEASKARLIRYRHNDLEHLEALLKEYSSKGKTIFVVTESLFSMDGDYPSLPTIAALKAKYGFFWILDEAHAFGWYGEKGHGLAAEYNVTGAVDILVGTLGKSLVSQGGFALFHEQAFKEYLINASKSFFYTTYPAPVLAAIALQAIECIQQNSVTQNRTHIKACKDFCKSLQAIFPQVPILEGPVVPIILGNSADTLALYEDCKKQGLLVGAIRPPSVPKGTSRLRLSLNTHFLFDESAKNQTLHTLGLALRVGNSA